MSNAYADGDKREAGRNRWDEKVRQFLAQRCREGCLPESKGDWERDAETPCSSATVVRYFGKSCFETGMSAWNSVLIHFGYNRVWWV